MRPTKFLLIWLLGVILLTACSRRGTPIDASIKIEARRLSFPSAYYESIVYIDNKLVGFSEDSAKAPSESISFAYENDTTLHPFNPKMDEECRYTFYSVNGTLPDGRLGLLKTCGKPSLRDVRSIFAYNWQTHELQQLVHGALPEGWSPRFFTWNPELTRGVQEMTDNQGTIYWLSPDGISPMDIEIQDQGLKWNLKDYYEGKDRVGIVRFPAWSPDGNTIAFFTSVYGIREEPVPKMNIRYDLFLMGASNLRPTKVIQDVANAFRLQWSPDSKRLLFGGCIGTQLQCALWIYDIGTDSLALIDKGNFQDFTWMTNGKVAAIKNIALPFENNEIWTYTIE